VLPVLTVPFLTGGDQLLECIASVEPDKCRVMVIDNSESGVPEGLPDDVWVVSLPHNLGVAASWNLAIKCHPQEPFWLIANHDTVFTPGDLPRLVAEMERPGPRWVGMNGDWRVFGINGEAIERVGWFDESFVPIYCEDADYEYRCALAGVPWYFIEGGATHVGSASLREPRYREANARTYLSNRSYYARKWGGDIRGGEMFTTPFARGGSVSDWTPDLRRLRDNAWEGRR
jgi:GT2 family glycosyltransferase